MTVRNVLVTPLLIIRAPIMLLGMAFETIGLGLQRIASVVPGWVRP